MGCPVGANLQVGRRSGVLLLAGPDGPGSPPEELGLAGTGSIRTGYLPRI